jgi:phage I-like protein
MSVRKHAVLIDTVAHSDGVERAGPGSAPTAFRIWRAGKNRADDGEITFTRESARLLMEEQKSRARPYSIDFDHLSLLSDRPANAGRAAGWHSIEARPDKHGEPELWAVNIEWCTDARNGLEEKPPHWRFASPAFVTTKDGEVTSYINFALCINPMSHGIPLLAARTAATGEQTMLTKEQALAALRTLQSSEATDEDKLAAIKELETYLEAEEEEIEEDAGEEVLDAEDGEGAEQAAASDDGEDEEKKEAKAHAIAKPAKRAKQAADAASLAVAEELARMHARMERIERDRLIEKRKDLPPSLRQWCMTQPIGVVKSFLTSMQREHAHRNATPTKGAQTPAGLQGRDLEEMNRAMGLHTHSHTGPRRAEDGSLILPVVRPSDLRAQAQKGKD